MATLVSPGVSVTITDESFYNTAGLGTIPLIILATASNKPSPTGTGIAPYTTPEKAGKLYLATGQRDLIQNFGNPIFYSSQGTPLHGYELNEYGLWTAHSLLGISNQAYVVRADIDLGQMLPSTTAPKGPPISGTYWLDLTQTLWGVLRANGNAVPGKAWSKVPVLVATVDDIDDSDVPLTSFGNNNDICVVPFTSQSDAVPSNLFYEKLSGTWYPIGTSDWTTNHPNVVTGTATSGTLVQNNTFTINGTTVTLSQASPTFANVVSDITSAAPANITAVRLGSGAIQLTNTAGGAVTLANGIGTPLATLGLPVGTVPAVSVTRSSDASYPSGVTVGSLWVKGRPANNGAAWSVKYYNGSIGAFTVLSAPFYQFDSTQDETDPSTAATKDTAAIAGIRSPTVGMVYVGYDVATGVQQLRRWSGNRWLALIYEPNLVAPSTDPAEGTLWYNTDFAADIMYNNGTNWLGYKHHFANTDPNGPQIEFSPPTTQSDGTTSLVDGDLWIDTSDLEHYPAINRWNATSLRWELLDNTDQTTPFGVTFGDARANSGPTFTGITNPSAYTHNSTKASDLALSDYVDPDAPDPRLYPTGMLLFNTRASTYNVKRWKPNYFQAGGYDADTDFTVGTYQHGSFTFPAVAAERWVSAAGNAVDGSPHMGRKSQRMMIVDAMAAVIEANQEIRSEIVFFNLSAAPGYPELIPDLITLNNDMKQVSFNVGDTPARLKPDGTSILTWASNLNDASITGEDGLTVGDDYTGVYYPWGLGVNLDGTEIMIPPSAIALRTIVYNDQVAYPWYAPAGYTRGLVSNATSVGYLNSNNEFTATILNQGQRDVLYTHKINPIAYVPNRGLIVFGQKTLDPIDSAMDRINVARLMNYISYNLDIILKPFLFQQNTHTTRTAAKAVVDHFLSQLMTLNGLYDFATVCDASNNDPARIDQYQLWIDCAVQPTKTVEFIYVPVRILTTQTVT